VGLVAYANLLRNANRSDDAVRYETLNKQYVDYWLKNANVSSGHGLNPYVACSNMVHCVTLQDGDHYKRQYNLNDSWSLKFNLFYQVNNYRLI